MEVLYNKKRSWLVGFLYALILFCVIYNPPVDKVFSFTKGAVSISFVYIFLNFNWIKKFFRIKEIRKLFSLFFVFILYYAIIVVLNFRESFNDVLINTFLQSVLTDISIFFVSFGIVIWCLKKGISFDNLSDTYIMAALIEMVFVFLCVASPSIKMIFNGMMAMFSDSSDTATTIEYTFSFRSFGWASNLYDQFGLTMGLIAIIAINKAFKSNSFYYLIALLIIGSGGVNARSAIFFFLFGFCYMMLYTKKGFSKNRGKRLFYLSFVLIVVSSVFEWIINNSSQSEQFAFLSDGITQTQSFAKGKNVGYFDTLINDFLFFPDSISMIFGTGLSPYQAIKRQSDVGYVQHIWEYGIIGSIILYSFYIKLLAKAHLRSVWPDSTMFRAFLIMILLYEVKLTSFGYSMSGIVYVPLCLYSIYNENARNTYKK